MRDTDRSARQAQNIVHTLTNAYGLKYDMIPFDQADSDTRRALSDLSPVVKETTAHRYGIVEDITLRTYTSVLESALAALEGVEICSDTWQYDTRNASGATCIAFGVLDDAAHHTHDFVVSLRPGPELVARHSEMLGTDRLMDLTTGETLFGLLEGNAEMEKYAFAESRSRWAQQESEDAAAGLKK